LSIFSEQEKQKIASSKKNKKNVSQTKKNQQVSSDPDLFCAN
jgi:hypothetical protein